MLTISNQQINLSAVQSLSRELLFAGGVQETKIIRVLNPHIGDATLSRILHKNFTERWKLVERRQPHGITRLDSEVANFCNILLPLTRHLAHYYLHDRCTINTAYYYDFHLFGPLKEPKEDKKCAQSERFSAIGS